MWDLLKTTPFSTVTRTSTGKYLFLYALFIFWGSHHSFANAVMHQGNNTWVYARSQNVLLLFIFISTHHYNFKDRQSYDSRSYGCLNARETSGGAFDLYESVKSVWSMWKEWNQINLKSSGDTANRIYVNLELFEILIGQWMFSSNPNRKPLCLSFISLWRNPWILYVSLYVNVQELKCVSTLMLD